MLYLTKNSTKRITCEANELNTTGHYLFRIRHDQYDKNDNILVYLVETYVSDRYIEFNIDLPNDVDLPHIGYYTYEIYNGDGVDLDYTTMTLLEVGKLKVDE